ncbi:hypothetical protein EV363DRAFT_1583749 [Boletus edulis]|nr:hypothetical protein EV363DRAFT_1583749 [Boletus edulis]
MYDAPDRLCDTFYATFEDGDPPIDTSRPTTPLPDRSRTLRRTISYASIDTVRPPNKGIRRRIEDIAENLKQKSTKKKKNQPSIQDVLKNAARDGKSDSKIPPESRKARHGQKATSPLRDSLHQPEEKSVLSIADRLNSSAPLDFELDPPLTVSGCKSDSLVDALLFTEEEDVLGDCAFPVRCLQPGAHVATEHKDTFQSPKIDIKDVQLDIRASETDVTIWDGLQTPHHVFKYRLFLRCTTHPYDSVSLPDIRRVETDCNTKPAGSRYARPPVLQAAYLGAAPGRVTNLSELPKVNPKAGIHMDRVWCKIRDDDGTWGWYRDAFVPLSSRLFDKMEYREFELVSRVWVGESWIENELTFGISMLLRGVDMK